MFLNLNGLLFSALVVASLVCIVSADDWDDWEFNPNPWGWANNFHNGGRVQNNWGWTQPKPRVNRNMGFNNMWNMAAWGGDDWYD